MAIVKLGALLTGIRGSVGGVTFSANKAGPYCKLWAAPPRPVREATAAQQGALGGLPSEWRALTQSLRDDWDTWAALPAQEKTNSLGEAYYCSGWNWFCELGLNLLKVGRPISTSVPVIAKPSSPAYTLILEASGVGADSRVTYAAGTFDPDLDLILEVQIVSSQGRAVWPLPYAYVSSSLNPGATSFSFQPALESVFGNVWADQRGFAALYKGTTEGYRSAPAVEFVDVV